MASDLKALREVVDEAYQILQVLPLPEDKSVRTQYMLARSMMSSAVKLADRMLDGSIPPSMPDTFTEDANPLKLDLSARLREELSEAFK